MDLIVNHSAGYFSNMTIRLYELISFMKTHGCYPDKIDSSNQFGFYKSYDNENVSELYIKTIDTEIPFDIPKLDKDFMAFQFDNYKDLDFDSLKNIVYKYFSPSELVELTKLELKTKYNLDKYISVFYRGNDKSVETANPSYKLFIQKAKELECLNLPFVVLPDECKFLKAFKKEIKNVITFEETPCCDLPNSNYIFDLEMDLRPQFGANYNAIVKLLSEGEHLITHSGNGGVRSCLYRGNANNVHQIYKDKIYE